MRIFLRGFKLCRNFPTKFLLVPHPEFSLESGQYQSELFHAKEKAAALFKPRLP